MDLYQVCSHYACGAQRVYILFNLSIHVLLIETFPCSLNKTADLSKFIAGLCGGAMISYTLLSSHTQVSDPGPDGPLVKDRSCAHLFNVSKILHNAFFIFYMNLFCVFLFFIQIKNLISIGFVLYILF